MNEAPAAPLPPAAPPLRARRPLRAAGAAAFVLIGAALWWRLRPTPLEKARKALDGGDPAAAVEILLARLEKAPAESDEALALRRELVRGYLMKGAYDAAEKPLRELLAARPDDAEAHLAMGCLFFSRGQDAFAADHLRKADALAPQDARAARALAALHNFRGEHDKAREAALALLDRAPTDAAARTALGEAELGRGLFADAAQAFEAAAADNPAAQRRWARALLSAGDWRGARERISPLLDKSPEDPALLMLQADVFKTRAAPADAEAIYRRILERDPRRLFAGTARAELLAAGGREEEAQTLLMEIARDLPKTEDVAPPAFSGFYAPWEALEARAAVRDLRAAFHRAMAAVYRARYLLPDAERQLRLALELAPRDADALRALTDVKRLAGDPRDALAAALDADALLPQHPQILLDLAERLLAVNRPQEALTYSQAAVTACPALARAHAVHAQALAALGRGEAAAKSVAEAIRLNDRDPAGPLAEGLLLARAGKAKDAAEAFGRALELDPGLARAHWERAKALGALKREKDARHHRERALALEPLVYARRPR